MRIRLLKPFWQAARNRFLPAGRLPGKTQGLLVFCLAVCVVLYFLSLRVVGYFHSQNELGIILSLKIFQMAWIMLFALLLFSNTVAAMSALYLSRDTDIILAAPVELADLFFLRAVTTTFSTSWMMVLFCLPIFLAYGTVFEAGPLYPWLTVTALLEVAMVAGFLAMAVTVVLVRLFPARRTKDIILYLSLLFGLVLYLMFRLLRPEDMINPDKFGQFVDYLSTVSTPAGPYVPAAWAANLLSLYMMDREVDWLLLCLLTVTVPALLFVGEWLMETWFFTGHTRSQESFGGHRRFSASATYRPMRFLQFAGKELKTFLRDTSEWSQLFMIGALVAVYLYNFQLLPLDRAYMQKENLANLIAFCNIGLSGFLIISLAARFVFPAVGSEGGAFAMLRAAPLSMARFMAYKYCCYMVPFTLLAVILVMVSNRLLGVEGPMAMISLAVILPITQTVLALALAFGALHADFRAPNRAAAVGSMGAMFFLLTAMTYELTIILTGSWPIFRITRKWLRGIESTPADWGWLFLWSIFTLIGSFTLAWIMLKKSIKKIELSDK